MHISITDAHIKAINIISENIVCLTISNFIFSFSLFFTIDLYNLNPLTAKAKIAGIINIFCNNKEVKIKINPFVIPSDAIQAEIVYPKQKPLYKTIPKTIGIPITVVPKNHITTASIIFSLIHSFSNCILFTLSLSLNLPIKLFKYVLISALPRFLYVIYKKYS